VGVLRTKADCARNCIAGPIAVVYPDGASYSNCDSQNLETIIQSHLIGGKVVEEFSFATHPLVVGGPRMDAADRILLISDSLTRSRAR
jgi:(2Fe-2S) ferredoxin